MQTNRRSFILTAAMASVVPSIVRADSLKGMPLIDPSSKRGMIAAESWAVNEHAERPACRLKFSDGSAYNWMQYSHTKKGDVYAVAIEIATTDERGHRIVTSIPIDGVGLERQRQQKIKEQAEIWENTLRIREQERRLRPDRFADRDLIF